MDWSFFFFSPVEWRNLEGIKAVIDKFLLASKDFEAEKTPTSNLVVFHLYNLDQFLKKTMTSSSCNKYV